MSRRAFDGVLRRYGEQALLTGETGARRARAVIRPVPERSGEGTQVLPTPLGRRRTDRFLYLGEPGVPVAWGDRVEWSGPPCRVSRAQAIRVGREISHWRAELRPEDEE